MSDWYSDPAMQPWLAHVRHQVIPAIQGSALSMIVSPDGEPDLKLAVELGLSVLFNKPIIVVVPPGRVPPAGLARIAHEVVVGDVTTAEGRRHLHDAMERHAP
jgi:hypothetical protein